MPSGCSIPIAVAEDWQSSVEDRVTSRERCSEGGYRTWHSDYAYYYVAMESRDCETGTLASARRGLPLDETFRPMQDVIADGFLRLRARRG